MTVAFLASLLLLVAAPGATQTSSIGLGAARQSFERGLGYYREGRYREALSAFREAERIKPSPRLSFDIARCLEQLEDWPAAISEYQKLATTSLDPRERKESEEKIVFLRTRLPPPIRAHAEAVAHAASATAAYQRADYDTAIAEWSAALQIQPSAAWAQSMGRVYERAQKPAAALEAYRSARKLGPTPAESQELEARIRWLEEAQRSSWPELAIRSEPTGAEVVLDDRRSGNIGKTNLRRKIAPGAHQLWIDLGGFEPIKKSIVMPEGAPLELEFKLEKMQRTGRLGIAVNVDDAEIYVDGEIIGFSPYRVKRTLPAGDHDVRVQAAGFKPFLKTVRVEVDKDSEVAVRFKLWNEESVERELEGLEDLDEDEGVRKPTPWDLDLWITGGLVAALGVVAPFFIDQYALSSDVNPNPRQGTIDTLHTIQIGSAIGAGVLIIGGIVLHFSGVLDR